jgi:predicted nuclease of predicted toxin-antitoxin system
MRLLADEGISPITIKWLRAQGHQVIGVREQGIFSADDSIVLALALAHRAILLTRDVADFSRMSYLAGEPHLGIMMVRPGKDQTPQHINQLLADYFTKYPDVDLTSRIVVITPRRIRFRPPLE